MILPIVLGVSIVGLLAWELWICEGAHFGRRFVVWLYDLAAGRYDRIKHFDPDWERNNSWTTMQHNSVGQATRANYYRVNQFSAEFRQRASRIEFFIAAVHRNRQ